MKSLLTLVFFTLFLVSCENGKSSSSEQKTIDSSELQPGPIVHDNLTKVQLEKITFIHKTFQEVYPETLENTINNFKRDRNPDSEINIWMAMANTYTPFAKKNNASDQLNKRKEGFSLILMLSMMSEEQAIESVNPKFLNPEEIKQLIKSYTLDNIPVKIQVIE